MTHNMTRLPMCDPSRMRGLGVLKVSTARVSRLLEVAGWLLDLIVPGRRAVNRMQPGEERCTTITSVAEDANHKTARRYFPKLTRLTAGTYGWGDRVDSSARPAPLVQRKYDRWSP